MLGLACRPLLAADVRVGLPDADGCGCSSLSGRRYWLRTRALACRTQSAADARACPATAVWLRMRGLLCGTPSAANAWVGLSAAVSGGRVGCRVGRSQLRMLGLACRTQWAGDARVGLAAAVGCGCLVWAVRRCRLRAVGLTAAVADGVAGGAARRWPAIAIVLYRCLGHLDDVLTLERCSASESSTAWVRPCEYAWMSARLRATCRKRLVFSEAPAP